MVLLFFKLQISFRMRNISAGFSQRYSYIQNLQGRGSDWSSLSFPPSSSCTSAHLWGKRQWGNVHEVFWSIWQTAGGSNDRSTHRAMSTGNEAGQVGRGDQTQTYGIDACMCIRQIISVLECLERQADLSSFHWWRNWDFQGLSSWPKS